MSVSFSCFSFCLVENLEYPGLSFSFLFRWRADGLGVCLFTCVFLPPRRPLRGKGVCKQTHQQANMHACMEAVPSGDVQQLGLRLTFPPFLFCSSLFTFSWVGTLVFCLALCSFSSIAYIRCIFSTGGGVGRMYFYERSSALITGLR